MLSVKGEKMKALVALVVKNLPANAGDNKRHGFFS